MNITKYELVKLQNISYENISEDYNSVLNTFIEQLIFIIDEINHFNETGKFNVSFKEAMDAMNELYAIYNNLEKSVKDFFE